MKYNSNSLELEYYMKRKGRYYFRNNSYLISFELKGDERVEVDELKYGSLITLNCTQK